MSTKKKRDTRGLVNLEFQAKKAETIAAADRGASRGWLGLNSAGIGGGVGDGICVVGKNKRNWKGEYIR